MQHPLKENMLHNQNETINITQQECVHHPLKENMLHNENETINIAQPELNIIRDGLPILLSYSSDKLCQQLEI